MVVDGEVPYKSVRFPQESLDERFFHPPKKTIIPCHSRRNGIQCLQEPLYLTPRLHEMTKPSRHHNQQCPPEG